MMRFFLFRYDQYRILSKINSFRRLRLRLTFGNLVCLDCYYKDLFLIFKGRINYASNLKTL